MKKNTNIKSEGIPIGIIFFYIGLIIMFLSSIPLLVTSLSFGIIDLVHIFPTIFLWGIFFWGLIVAIISFFMS